MLTPPHTSRSHPRRRAHDPKSRIAYVRRSGAVGGVLSGVLALIGMGLLGMHWAQTDHLTRVGSRRSFDQSFRLALKAARKKNYVVGLVMIDIDHFKRLNDSLGHQAGDEALAATGKALRASKKAAFRYGGEEFVVILSGHDAQAAATVADDLRQRIAACWSRSEITASAGVAVFPADGRVPSELVEAADAALYVSKSEGRNRTTISGSSTTKP